ncbi:MAG: enoyl-CoA hydratase-related protein [Bacillota bacterium]|jgi:enoyl-CoA hydratase
MAFWNMETSAEGIGILTIDRPEALNALNQAVLDELDARLEEIAANRAIKVLIVTGSGRAFISGADIAAMRDMTPTAAEEFSRFGQRVFDKLASLPQPTIAAINGYALGGGLELALACDLRLASEKARLGQPEIGLGIIPGFGGTQRLPRLIGMAAANELLFTGEMINAARAAELGLVSRVTATEELMASAQELAGKIAAKSGATLRLLKAVLRRSEQRLLDEGLVDEANSFAACYETHDQREGMSAFLEKRPPQFQDK